MSQPTASNFTNQDGFVAGNKRFTITQFTPTNAYVTGGFVLGPTANAYGFLGLNNATVVVPINGPSGLYDFQWDSTAKKLLVLYPQGGSITSPIGANDGSGFATPIQGATTVASTAAQPDFQVNTAAAREVQSGANLSGISIWIWAIGQ